MKYICKWPKVTFLTVAIVCSFAYTSVPITSYAARTSTEMIKKKKNIDQKITELKNEMKDLKDQMQLKIDEFQKNKEEIDDVHNSIIETEKRIERRSTIIEERLQAYQKVDSTMGPYFDAIFGAKSIAEVISRTISVRTILDADHALLTEQQSDKKELEETKLVLDKKKEKLQQQFQEMQEQEKYIEVKKAENIAKSLKLKIEIASAKEKERLERIRIKKEKEAARLKALAEEQFIQQQRRELAQAKEKERISYYGSNVANGENIGAGNGNNGAKVTDADQTAPTIVGSKIAQIIVGEASKYLGTSYAWSGSNPSTGFDCSGLTRWAFKKAGISIPRTAAQQYIASKKISPSEARAGDLIFFSYGSGIAHVGIYLGDGRMINAQNNGVVVESLSWWNKYLVGYGRF